MKEYNENNEMQEGAGKFGLPEGYFQKSASSIFNKIEWQEEHIEFPGLLALKEINPFTTPKGYFENGARLELLEYPALLALQKQTPFSVPGNYFEEREVAELARVLTDAGETDFSHLNAIKKQNNFAVPQTYFSERASALNSTLEKRSGKVIPLFTKRISYAVAALLVIALGYWIYEIYSPQPVAVDCGTIACLEKQDVVKSKNLEGLDDDELYELVDPSALEQKLQQAAPAPKLESERDSSFDDLEDEDLMDEI